MRCRRLNRVLMLMYAYISFKIIRASLLIAILWYVGRAFSPVSEVANRDQSDRVQRRLWHFKRVLLCREVGRLNLSNQTRSSAAKSRVLQHSATLIYTWQRLLSLREEDENTL